MRSVKAVSVPAMCSASASVASLPDCVSTPCTSTSTGTGLAGSMKLREPPVRQASALMVISSSSLSSPFLSASKAT